MNSCSINLPLLTYLHCIPKEKDFTVDNNMGFPTVSDSFDNKLNTFFILSLEAKCNE